MTEFASKALTGPLGLTSEERLLHTLIGDLPASQTMSLRVANGLTTARIRYALAELVNMNLDNAHLWLQQVAEQSPKAALELLMELVKYNVPQVKAVAINLRDESGNVRQLSVTELERIASGDEGGPPAVE